MGSLTVPSITSIMLAMDAMKVGTGAGGEDFGGIGDVEQDRPCLD